MLSAPSHRAIAQADERGHIDGVEQLARLFAGQHRGLADLDDVLRPAHRMRGIGRDHLAGEEPSNSMRIAARCSLTVGFSKPFPRPRI